LSPSYGSNSYPPSSGDKALAIKMYKNGERAQSGSEHQRTPSMMSDGTRQTLLAFQDGEAEVRLNAFTGGRCHGSTPAEVDRLFHTSLFRMKLA
jgi:hypothetical protein